MVILIFCLRINCKACLLNLSLLTDAFQQLPIYYTIVQANIHKYIFELFYRKKIIVCTCIYIYTYVEVVLYLYTEIPQWMARTGFVCMKQQQHTYNY